MFIEDLENPIAPAGVSDAVGGPVCIVVAVVLILWPNQAN
jgi:hypothetical protein